MITRTVANFSVLFFIAVSVCKAEEKRTIVYPGHERNDYIILLLNAVFNTPPNTNKYLIRPYGEDLPKGRAYEKMANNEGIDIVMGGSTPERESKYQPIRFPLLKGLHGWRIPLVHEKNAELFAHVSDIISFTSLVAGQFHTWSDTQVLESNGIRVSKGTDYAGLYAMLHQQRFDYFPRSIVEVDRNIEQFNHFDIAKDKHILIHYPTAYYYYVRKGDNELAADIKAGLEYLHTSGELQRLFMASYGEQVEKTAKEGRHVIRLTNTKLSPLTPLDREELWLNLEEAR
ncbi:hypothetical protein ACFSJY_12865 [Thalassotalea euphylliae]|uniref:hypothetical protein n=1 Tax=Thalassotalea euphylliae TaxID=1655234 RepID=UPI00363C8B4F